MIHSVLQIVLGYLLWKYFPDWVRLRDSRTIDHYVIIGLSLVGVLMMLCGVFRLLGALLPW